jgi:hypothetical protein
MCHLESKYIIQTHFENVQIYASEKFTTILCMCVSEPVRHRDYTAAYKQRYPSTPFKILKQRQESRNYKLKFEEPEVQRPPKSNVTIDTPGQVYEFDVVGDRRIDLLEDHHTNTF